MFAEGASVNKFFEKIQKEIDQYLLKEIHPKLHTNLSRLIVCRGRVSIEVKQAAVTYYGRCPERKPKLFVLLTSSSSSSPKIS